jgi:hypothetical protein
VPASLFHVLLLKGTDFHPRVCFGWKNLWHCNMHASHTRSFASSGRIRSNPLRVPPPTFKANGAATGFAPAWRTNGEHLNSASPQHSPCPILSGGGTSSQLLGERANLSLKAGLKSDNIPLGRLCGLLLRLFVSLSPWTTTHDSLPLMVGSVYVSIKCGHHLFPSWWSETKYIMHPCCQQDDGDLFESQAM